MRFKGKINVTKTVPKVGERRGVKRKCSCYIFNVTCCRSQFVLISLFLDFACTCAEFYHTKNKGTQSGTFVSNDALQNISFFVRL